MLDATFAMACPGQDVFDYSRWHFNAVQKLSDLRCNSRSDQQCDLVHQPAQLTLGSFRYLLVSHRQALTQDVAVHAAARMLQRHVGMRLTARMYPRVHLNAHM